MAGTILINTEQVLAIANDIETQNKQLRELLEESRALVQSLSSSWEGEAAEATYTAYKSFADKYFQNYEDIIQSYVKFLRQNVVSDYEATESSNTSLADAFK